jgi:hypothetical protein
VRWSQVPNHPAGQRRPKGRRTLQVGPPERGLHFGGGGLGRSARQEGAAPTAATSRSFTLRTPFSTRASISAPVYLRYRTGAIGRFWPNRAGAMQHLGYGLL